MDLAPDEDPEADVPDAAGARTRVTDRDRDRTVEVLRHGAAEGALDLEEFAERVSAAYRARTAGELVGLTADLPEPPAAPVPADPAAQRRLLAAGRRPGRLSRKWALGILSGSKVRGRWRVEQDFHAVAVMGHCQIDLCDAEFDGDELTIYVVTFLGGVEVLVPEGVPVEIGGVAVLGGIDSQVRRADPAPGAPLVRVRAFCLFGGATARSARFRRGWSAGHAPDESAA